MIWSKQSVLMAVSLAAMVPSIAPRPASNTRGAATAITQPAPVSTLTAADALMRAQAACAIGSDGRASATQVSELVRLLGDDTRVETPDCGQRGWGGRFGAEPVVCLSSPAQEAARALARIGRLAVAPLIAALADPASAVRRHAAVALGLFDDRVAAAPAIPRLVATLADADWQVRRSVVWALGETGDGSVMGPVSRTLADVHPRVRTIAAQALGEIDDVRAVDALIGALRDTDPEVREMVAWALGELEQERAVPGLVAALTDADWRPRAKAAWALGEISRADAVDGLVRALGDDHLRVREMSAWALGEIEKCACRRWPDPRADGPGVGGPSEGGLGAGGDRGRARIGPAGRDHEGPARAGAQDGGVGAGRGAGQLTGTKDKGRGTRDEGRRTELDWTD